MYCSFILVITKDNNHYLTNNFLFYIKSFELNTFYSTINTSAINELVPTNLFGNHRLITSQKSKEVEGVETQDERDWLTVRFFIF